VADDTYDVFVSYSRADGRHAKEIDSVLRDKGLKTFFDRRNLATGLLRPLMLSRLLSNLKKQKTFRISIEPRRQGFSYAGSAAAQGVLSIVPSLGESSIMGGINEFAHENASTGIAPGKHRIPTFRITVNDRLNPAERFVTISHELGHIFCGHLGACGSSSHDDEESGWPDRSSLGKNEKEVEAEAVAYLVASRAELVSGSAAYLTTYAQSADMKSIDVELIVRAAARIERLAKIHYGSMIFRREEGKQDARMAKGTEGSRCRGALARRSASERNR
jgi:hypothetical protein